MQSIIQHLNTIYESSVLNPKLTSVLVATTILVIFLSILSFRSDDVNANDDKKSTKNDSTTTTKVSPPLKNIFSQMRSAIGGGVKKEISTDKPFSSSYYYAHNSTSTTGGYKDGLSLTDYTMNQPRLLSKNGVPVVDKSDDDVKLVASTQPQAKKQPSTKITKFSWEDSYEYARIRIDSIPSPNSTSSDKLYIPWEEASISKSQVFVNLQGKRTLSIELLQSSNKLNQQQLLYNLYFQNLHADVKEATTFWKQNKLIIRLKKCVKKEWKELVQKDVVINEDLFRSNE